MPLQLQSFGALTHLPAADLRAGSKRDYAVMLDGGSTLSASPAPSATPQVGPAGFRVHASRASDAAMMPAAVF